MFAGRMTSISRYLFLLTMTLVSATTVAQSRNTNFDTVYGFDPLLYNGCIYSFFPPIGTSGTQYLLDAFDVHGSVTLRGVTYSNLNLNYDIYNQQLVVKYLNAYGSLSLFTLSDAWLESFDLHGGYFEISFEDSTSKRIYQVIGKGEEKIKYSLSKELLIDNTKNVKTRYFSDVITKKYIYTEGHLSYFTNNRNFAKAFKPLRRDLIVKYIHDHRINVRKSNSLVMNELINYCNTTSGL